ncbi:MAG: MarR family transcriptional regulator [Opitutales bacterium]|nr:MarR family transcriptional regulator [Opitutales bacterium]
MNLHPTAQKFIVHWGEMGTRWGINRSVAQIHALLYLSPEPLAADEIVETLAIARSNVSTGLRELQTWGLVRATQVLGDRRDRFSTATDVWELFRVILRERKRRELDPTLAVLRECVAEAKAAPAPALPHLDKRLGAMLEYMELADSWGERAARLEPAKLRRLAKLGDSIFKLAE